MDMLANMPPLQAQAVAAHLRSQGVMAMAITSMNATPLPTVGGARVVLLDRRDARRAAELARAFLAIAPQGAPLDESNHPRPDLSRLPAGLTVLCPSCGGRFVPGAPDFTTCCGTAADVCELIAVEHGPEVLEECFPLDPVDAIDANELRVSCEQCGYSLEGLAEEGICPECGAKFNMEDRILDLVRRVERGDGGRPGNPRPEPPLGPGDEPSRV